MILSELFDTGNILPSFSVFKGSHWIRKNSTSLAA